VNYDHWLVKVYPRICNLHAVRLHARQYVAALQARRFWSNESTYDYRISFPERARAQVDFTKRFFLPCVSERSRVIDVGCADGWHSLQIAPHVGSLVGFDSNQHFVSLAQDAATRDEVANAHFFEADIRSLKLTRVDAVVCAGLLTCLNDKQAKSILGKVRDALVPGGPLLLKDTLSIAGHSSEGVVYVDRRRGAFYRSQAVWEQMIEHTGFQVVQGEIIHDTGTGFVSRMALAIRR